MWKGEHSQNDFGNEAIQVILKKMEDCRDDFVVIIAGYPKPMDRLLKSNEGLKSRFTSFILFDDYSTDELADIFNGFCTKENYLIGDEASKNVLSIIENQYNVRDDTFGNGRFVRNLFQLIIRNHAMRIGTTNENPSDIDLRTIIPADVQKIKSSKELSPGEEKL